MESPRRSCQQEETHEGAPDQPPQLPASPLLLLPPGPWLPLPNWGEAAARVAAASEEAAMAYFIVAMLVSCR